MARQDLADGIDKPVLIDLVLSFGLLLQIQIAVLDVSEAGAEDQILDLDLAFRSLVRTLDDRAWRIASVGIFHLLADAVLRIAQIKLRANVFTTQSRDHLLIVRDLPSEHGD